MTIFTDYITLESLASYHVETPDPALIHPPLGQRLLLSWSLPKEYKSYSNLHIILTIRFYSREEVVKDLHIRRASGTYVFYLLNEEYCERGGIASYKALLEGDGHLLEEWRHQLWAELILPEEEKTEDGASGQQDNGTFDKDLIPSGRRDPGTQDNGTTGHTTDGTYRTIRTKDNRTQDNQDTRRASHC